MWRNQLTYLLLAETGTKWWWSHCTVIRYRQTLGPIAAHNSISTSQWEDRKSAQLPALHNSSHFHINLSHIQNLISYPVLLKSKIWLQWLIGDLHLRKNNPQVRGSLIYQVRYSTKCLDMWMWMFIWWDELMEKFSMN